MDKFDNNYLLMIMGLIAIILEMLLGAPTGFDLLLLGVIFLIGGGIGTLTSSFLTALIIIILLSFIYIFIGRKMIKKRLNVTTRKTNIDNLIGKKAIVIKKITSDKPGQIKVEGEIWRAESESNIDAGKQVIIDSLSGVTFMVTPVK